MGVVHTCGRESGLLRVGVEGDFLVARNCSVVVGKQLSMVDF